LGGVVK